MEPMEEGRDDKLSRLLRAAQAELDPFLWTRVRARIEAGDRAPGALAWLTRPAALAASLAVFMIATVSSLALVRGMPWQQPYEVVSLTDQLIAESDPEESPAGPVTPQPGAASDTGGRR